MHFCVITLGSIWEVFLFLLLALARFNFLKLFESKVKWLSLIVPLGANQIGFWPISPRLLHGYRWCPIGDWVVDNHLDLPNSMGHNWRGFCTFSVCLLTVPAVKSWLCCIMTYYHVSEPPISHLYNRHNNRNYPIGLLWAFKELSHIKHHLAWSKCSNKNSNFSPCSSKFRIYNMKNWRILAVLRVRAGIEGRVSSHPSV